MRLPSKAESWDEGEENDFSTLFADIEGNAMAQWNQRRERVLGRKTHFNTFKMLNYVK